MFSGIYVWEIKDARVYIHLCYPSSERRILRCNLSSTVSPAKRALIRTSRILPSPCPPSCSYRWEHTQESLSAQHSRRPARQALEITESSGCDGAEIAIVCRTALRSSHTTRASEERGNGSPRRASARARRLAFHYTLCHGNHKGRASNVRKATFHRSARRGRRLRSHARRFARLERNAYKKLWLDVPITRDSRANRWSILTLTYEKHTDWLIVVARKDSCVKSKCNNNRLG